MPGVYCVVESRTPWSIKVLFGRSERRARVVYSVRLMSDAPCCPHGRVSAVARQRGAAQTANSYTPHVCGAQVLEFAFAAVTQTSSKAVIKVTVGCRST